MFSLGLSGHPRVEWFSLDNNINPMIKNDQES